MSALRGSWQMPATKGPERAVLREADEEPSEIEDRHRGSVADNYKGHRDEHGVAVLKLEAWTHILLLVVALE